LLPRVTWLLVEPEQTSPIRIGIADYGQRAIGTTAYFASGTVQSIDSPVRLAGHEIDHTRRRRAEGAAKRVVIQGKVLCVVPQGRDGIPVEVAHY